MAITALAGPVCNLLTALVALALASLLYHFGSFDTVMVNVLLVLIYLAVLSVGLGVFNLIPIPPLDGSKVLFSLLPDRAYWTILRYERYVMIVLFALVFFGVLDTPLGALRSGVLQGLCNLTQFPFELLVSMGVA
jgi:Zn-dependent protease